MVGASSARPFPSTASSASTPSDLRSAVTFHVSLITLQQSLAPHITAVFTIGHVVRMLGEDEGCLQELSIDMESEEDRLHVYGIGEDGVTTFTRFGIEHLQEIVADQRAAGLAPPKPGSSQ